MSELIQTKRRQYQECIRQQHLHQYFSEKRKLLLLPNQMQLKQQLSEILMAIRTSIHHSNRSQMVQALFDYQKMADTYQIGDALLNSAYFSCALQVVQNGIIPVECSYGQLFAILLAQEQENDIIMVLLNIAEINTCQLRKLTSRCLKQVREVVESILSNFPLKLLKTKTFWFTLLKLIGEIIVTSSLCVLKEYLETYKLDILSVLSSILESQEFLQYSEHLVIFAQVSILTLTFFELPSGDSKTQAIANHICDSVEAILFKLFDDQSVSFNKTCFLLKHFWQIKSEISSDSFSQLTNYLSIGIKSCSFYYFQLLNAFIYLYPQTISQNMFEKILTFMFSVSAENEQNEEMILETKKWMILIIERHFKVKQYNWSIEEQEFMLQLVRNELLGLRSILVELYNFDPNVCQNVYNLLVRTIDQLNQSGYLCQEMKREISFSVPQLKKQLQFLPK